jgi:hypothetical protein
MPGRGGGGVHAGVRYTPHIELLNIPKVCMIVANAFFNFTELADSVMQ